MDDMILRADCTKCAALCCVALAFDRSRLFAVDKAAGQPCPNLDGCGACTIHHQRIERGFPGCITFDCLGAGQRVTQVIFGGRSWINDPSLLGPMSQAFSTMLRAHEHLSLLEQAERLDLSFPDRHKLTELRVAIEDAGATAAKIDALKPQIDAFLSSLRLYVEGEAITSGVP